MDDEQFDDLKQFITATVSQSETRMREELGGKIDGLRTEMQAGFAGAGGAIDALGDHIDERFDKVEARLDDDEQRITKLEEQTA